MTITLAASDIVVVITVPSYVFNSWFAVSIVVLTRTHAIVKRCATR